MFVTINSQIPPFWERHNYFLLGWIYELNCQNWALHLLNISWSGCLNCFLLSEKDLLFRLTGMSPWHVKGEIYISIQIFCSLKIEHQPLQLLPNDVNASVKQIANTHNIAIILSLYYDDIEIILWQYYPPYFQLLWYGYHICVTYIATVWRKFRHIITMWWRNY